MQRRRVWRWSLRWRDVEEVVGEVEERAREVVCSWRILVIS